MKKGIYISYIICLVLLIDSQLSNMNYWHWLRTMFTVGFMFTLIDAFSDHWKYYKLRNASPNGDEAE